MTTYIIRIEPDGTIIRMDESVVDLVTVAETALDAPLDIVTLHPNPITPFPRGSFQHPGEASYLVGAIDDKSRLKRMPLNPKVWALYGRSPLCGPCFVAFDRYDDHPGRPALPDEWIDEIERPLEEWTTPELLQVMKNLAKKENIPWA